MCSSVMFRIFMELRNHYHCLIPGHFYYPQKKPHHQLFPILPSSQLLATTYPFFYFADLSVLGILYKWNHVTFVSSFFTEHDLFKAHPCYSVCQYLIPFVAEECPTCGSTIFHLSILSHCIFVLFLLFGYYE